MKKTALLLLLLAHFSVIIGQNEDEKNLLPTTMFSAEGGYHYSSLNGKNGFELRTHVWFLRKNSLGPEFHFYAPSGERNYSDYQFDFNFKRILVDMHPLTFDFLIGPGFRSTRDSLSDKGDFIGSVSEEKRYWSFDGINLGFGVSYRWGDHSIYGMPRINNTDASIQISLGYKFHFNITTNDVFNNKYKLRKKKRKN
jgi:hypothetical protein